MRRKAVRVGFACVLSMRSVIVGCLVAAMTVIAGPAVGGPLPVYTGVNLPNRLAYPCLGAAVDVDRDGHPDLVVGTQTGVFVFPGNGPDVFPNWYRATDDALVVEGLFVADFNQDGWPDVLAAGRLEFDAISSANSVLRLFLNEPGAHFRTAFGLTGGVNQWTLQVADFNGDGLKDFVLCRTENSIPVAEVFETYLGTGQGAFSGPVQSRFPGRTCAYARYAGDLNGDGRADLVTSVGYQDINVWLANGDGSFQAPLPMVKPGPSRQVEDIVAGDFDGDGHRDLLARIAYNHQGLTDEYSVLYFGDGTGHFSSPVVLAEPTAPVDHRRYMVQQVVTDVNGDGRADILLVGPNALTSRVPGFTFAVERATDVYLGNGDGTFRGPIFSPNSGGVLRIGGNTGIQDRLPDIDGDARVDLVTLRDAGKYGALDVARGDGAGGFGPAKVVGSYEPIGLAVADFNGDGHPDIAVANQGSANVSVWLGDGAGGWSGPANYAVSDNEAPLAIIAADLNADGVIDLATAATAHNPDLPLQPGSSILYGDGAGHFALGRHLPGDCSGLVAADFDGDGAIDLALSDDATRRVDIFFNLPGATRQETITDVDTDPNDAIARWPATNIPYHTWNQELVAADFDRNGQPDLALARTSDAAFVSVFLNPGDAAHRRTVRVPMGLSPLSVAAGDLDGDGAPDLAAVSYDWLDPNSATPTLMGFITVALGDGRGGFGPAARYQLASDALAYNIAIADLDGRGQRAVVIDVGDSNLKAFLADSAGHLGAPIALSQGLGGALLRNVAVADLNHDGLLDIARPDAVFLNLGACGNGRLDANEECDDGNNVDCDGCSATCHLEVGARCGDGIVNAVCGEECDNGAANGNAPDACRADCRLPRCGDGVQDTAEECDDGNALGCDGCSARCTIDPAPVCGDGIVNTGCGEQCDDGNAVDGDGCSSTCQLELIPGGGAASTDCLTEWVVTNPHNVPARDRAGRVSVKQTCRDNDPTCDFDGGIAGSCTFHVTLCVNMTDPGLPRCTPKPLARYELTRPTTHQAARSGSAATLRTVLGDSAAALLAAPYGTCSPAMDVTVPLVVRPGGLRRSTQTVQMRVTTAARIRDTDTLAFTCLP